MLKVLGTAYRRGTGSLNDGEQNKTLALAHICCTHSYLLTISKGVGSVVTAVVFDLHLFLYGGVLVIASSMTLARCLVVFLFVFDALCLYLHIATYSCTSGTTAAKGLGQYAISVDTGGIPVNFAEVTTCSVTDICYAMITTRSRILLVEDAWH